MGKSKHREWYKPFAVHYAFFREGNMGKRYKDAGARCPYYCSEAPSKIYCSGVTEGNWIHMAWGDDKQRKEYKRCFCKGEYLRCPVAKMLWQIDEDM